RTLLGPVPDPVRPPILLYEPVGDKLQLVGAEWFIPLATGIKERPFLLGQPFEGPMEGHPPTQPPSLVHYDLHVWLFKPNPAGLFNPHTANVKCPQSEYPPVAEPSRIVQHRGGVTPVRPRVIRRLPKRSTSARSPGKMTVVEPYSSTIAGPPRTSPGC